MSPERIGALAQQALLDELLLHPKPGLVTPWSQGSHRDMDHAIFRASIDALGAALVDCARLGAQDRDFADLQACGLAAEARMLAATGGVNTHRGALFLLGLLSAAAGQAWAQEEQEEDASLLGERVRQRWGSAILAARPSVAEPYCSHGNAAHRRYGICGAREQAAMGFPVLVTVSLPALRAAFACGADAEAAASHCLLSTMAVLSDTNLVHRGGLAALAWTQQVASDFLASGSVFVPGWRERLLALDAEFVQRNLSPGGSADLLSATLFLQRINKASPAQQPRPLLQTA